MYILASCERSFSALKRIKTYLRNTMTEERLAGLALAHINNDMPIDPLEVLREFELAPRRFKRRREPDAPEEPIDENANIEM